MLSPVSRSQPRSIPQLRFAIDDIMPLKISLIPEHVLALHSNLGCLGLTVLSRPMSEISKFLCGLGVAEDRKPQGRTLGPTVP